MAPTMRGACRQKGKREGMDLKKTNEAKMHWYEHVKMSMPIARSAGRSSMVNWQDSEKPSADQYGATSTGTARPTAQARKCLAGRRQRLTQRVPLLRVVHI